MEPAILSILAFMLTVMLYLDRTRRNDIRDLRHEMNAGFTELRQETARLREDMNAGFTELRQEMHAGFTELRQEIQSSGERTDARIDQLTTTVINLAESLGQARGRTETLIATD